MFQREARWMLLRFVLVVAAAAILAMVVPALVGRRRMSAERCAAEGGIWDAHHGECHDDESVPRAMDRYGVPDRPPKPPPEFN